ncbi:MAG: aquaporin [Saprospiraceae bacterium]|nr:aquaporin [Saprospiraceae bacterium]
MNKYLAEGIGTFFLTLSVVILSGKNNATDASLAIGGALLALTYAFGPISGAHFNPAISIAMLIRGKIERLDLPYYLLAQVVGAVLASLMASFLVRCAGVSEVSLRPVDPICALVAEFLGAFLLASVFLQVTSARASAGNAYFGLAIGMALLAGMYTFGNLSGGIFNPAVALSMCMTGLSDWADYWAYFLGGLLGASAAASVFRVLHGEQD